MSEEAMREEVAQAVEVAANKAAEEEISKLAEFENAIDETLASGYLNDTLTVTDEDGVAQVLPVLDSSRSPALWKALKLWAGVPTCSCTPAPAWWPSAWWDTSPTKK